MEKIRISGIVEESIVDGPGIRFVVFVQGCSHNCKGCHNKESHDFKGGELVEIDIIIEMMKSNPLLKGLTLSGGEPFEQIKESLKLIKKAKLIGLDILVYSGYKIEELLEDKKYKKLLREVDILIDGPFIEEEKTEILKFRGSKNQRVLEVKDYL